jgi:cytochrome oxidase Cu insertion factor (SCO1/SenC/PrrC family)
MRAGCLYYGIFKQKVAMKTLFLILAIVIGALAASYHFAPQRHASSQASAGDGPAIGGQYTLTDEDGQPTTPERFAGRYQLVFFGFTNCPDICPTTLTTISQLMQQVDAEGEHITPVFISVDSGDAPAAMKVYLTNFHPAIVGLTGTPEQIKQAAAAYKVYYAKVEQPESSLGYTMDHSAYVFFMDENNRYLTHFSHDASAETMAQKITPYLENQP